MGAGCARTVVLQLGDLAGSAAASGSRPGAAGLRTREFWLLAIAGAGDVSQHEIAGLCGIDPSSLVAVLDDLERRGWLHRQRNPSDRRMQWVQRTEAGDRLFARALPRAQRAEARQLRCFPRLISASWWPPCASW